MEASELVDMEKSPLPEPCSTPWLDVAVELRPPPVPVSLPQIGTSSGDEGNRQCLQPEMVKNLQSEKEKQVLEIETSNRLEEVECVDQFLDSASQQFNLRNKVGEDMLAGDHMNQNSKNLASTVTPCCTPPGGSPYPTPFKDTLMGFGLTNPVNSSPLSPLPRSNKTPFHGASSCSGDLPSPNLYSSLIGMRKLGLSSSRWRGRKGKTVAVASVEKTAVEDGGASFPVAEEVARRK